MPLADVQVGATVTIVRFENEAEDLLHYLKDAGLDPGLQGTLAESGDDEVVFEGADGDRAARSPAASPRPCRSWPTRRRRRASRCPASSCSGGERYGR